MSVTEYLMLQAIRKGYKLIKKGNKIMLELDKIKKKRVEYTIDMRDISVDEIEALVEEYEIEADFQTKVITVSVEEIDYSKIINV